MQGLLKKSVLALAMILAASSIAAVCAQADTKAKHEKVSQESCDLKKHHDNEHYKTDKEQWKKTLTVDQQKEIAALKVALQKELSPLKAKISLKKAELNGLVASDRLDKASIDRLIGEIAELKKEKMQLRYGHKIKVRSLLTAEQKTLYDMSILDGDGHGNRK